MPPGTLRPRPTVRLRERTTAEACLAITRRVGEACRVRGDQPGLEATHLIAQAILQEILDPSHDPPL